ncbi:MAG: DUF1365 domain-containing protein [Pseudooceanicola sp.]|nr:DUF1365 domain-containing protein [Pseudooceanicola sp.]
MSGVLHLAGYTSHARMGAVRNSFRYAVDYVLLDAEATVRAPWFRRNRAGILSLHDRDHGGPPGQGRGAAWAREVLVAHRVTGVARLRLLAQPRVLGHAFNPVSFWLCEEASGGLIAVIAEVTNTYGDRHSYLCHRPGLEVIAASDEIDAVKVFHVSPFQPVAGRYRFRFDVREDRLAVRIVYGETGGGLIATLSGRLTPLTRQGALRMVFRLGSRRVLTLIHWQALKLWWKGAPFRHRPAPPLEEVSR